MKSVLSPVPFGSSLKFHHHLDSILACPTRTKIQTWWRSTNFSRILSALSGKAINFQSLLLANFSQFLAFSKVGSENTVINTLVPKIGPKNSWKESSNQCRIPLKNSTNVKSSQSTGQQSRTTTGPLEGLKIQRGQCAKYPRKICWPSLCLNSSSGWAGKHWVQMMMEF